eukprot:comp22015_c0_seq1/m.31885 comp22015_c0_seq1/g.31885  ORF comp22015_c0_seq1/g.31885 comp22015_c0_seq1/m.31885 type:complete len:127 (-) comp22015_c0_seq1:359-739(-)
MFVCVAIVDKNNSPLFIKTANQKDELEFSYIVHTALDVIEDKDSPDMYLGLLAPAEEYNVYGYMTNTKVKFVAVLDDFDASSKMKNFFRRLHGLYIDMACNAFYTPGTPIKSPRFTDAVQSLMDNF